MTNEPQRTSAGRLVGGGVDGIWSLQRSASQHCISHLAPNIWQLLGGVVQFVVGLHPLKYASNVRLPTLADSILADMQD